MFSLSNDCGPFMIVPSIFSLRMYIACHCPLVVRVLTYICHCSLVVRVLIVKNDHWLMVMAYRDNCQSPQQRRSIRINSSVPLPMGGGVLYYRMKSQCPLVMRVLTYEVQRHIYYLDSWLYNNLSCYSILIAREISVYILTQIQ